MTKTELSNAVELATSDVDLGNETLQIDIFDGFGLPDFKPVTVTTRQLAALIRWQAEYLGGGSGLDAAALNEIATIGRKRFLVV